MTEQVQTADPLCKFLIYFVGPKKVRTAEDWKSPNCKAICKPSIPLCKARKLKLHLWRNSRPLIWLNCYLLLRGTNNKGDFTSIIRCWALLSISHQLQRLYTSGAVASTVWSCVCSSTNGGQLLRLLRQISIASMHAADTRYYRNSLTLQPGSTQSFKARWAKLGYSSNGCIGPTDCAKILNTCPQCAHCAMYKQV